MAFDLDNEELKATRKDKGLDDGLYEDKKSNIEETKKKIEYWENEVQQVLKENNIGKAISCRILANKLREDIGERK